MQAENAISNLVEDFVVVDTETTGVVPSVHRLVEVAALRFMRGRPLTAFRTLLNPGTPIGAETSKIHHITDRHVREAPYWTDVRDEFVRFVGSSVVVAHNARFDFGFLPELRNSSWICTYRLARHLWPELPEHGNQYLRYALHLTDETEVVLPHSALDDAFVTGRLFMRECAQFVADGLGETLEDVRELTESPITVTHMPWGRHKGQPLSDIPQAYLEWYERQSSSNDPERKPDPDLAASVRAELLRRRHEAQPRVLFSPSGSGVCSCERPKGGSCRGEPAA
jgi:exodeoxyribonuclease X